MEKKCCLCNIVITHGMDSNNPDPLGKSPDDVCCNYCNISKVLPARIKKNEEEALNPMGKYKLVPMTEEEEYRNAGITKEEAMGRKT